MSIFNTTSGSMPGHLFEKTISDLALGESGWTVPWGMYVDESGQCYLNSGYFVRKARGNGTAQMKVTRLETGFAVDISHCNHKWNKNGACYVGKFDPLKVVRLKFR